MAIRLFIILFCFLSSVSCFASGQDRKLVVLFTTDLHSQLLPDSHNVGGFPRIATIVEQERMQAAKEDAAFLLLDGGDIAMGSVFHTQFANQAIEYRGMARLGYDAFALGNHCFDFGTDALIQMFRSAHLRDSLATFPQLLAANVQCKGIPSEKYTIIERNGLKIALLGLMGENSYNVIGSAVEDVQFADPVEVARKIVADLKGQADYIIAISHGGILNGDDKRLAKKVGGLDFIISAHDHISLNSPLKIGGTPIGAAGSNGKYVGKAVFSDGKLQEYALVSTDNSVPEDMAVKCWVDSMYNVVGEEFEKLSGRKLDDTIAFVEGEYPNMLDEDDNMALGSNIAASYAEAAIANVQGVCPSEVVGLVPYGMVRRGLAEGAVTNKDAFEVLSLGTNERGCTGYPLVYAWLTGDELKDLCEMTVSIAPYLQDTRLFFAGLQYRYNGARLPFIRVDRVKVNGQKVEPDKLYMVVTGEYTAKMIGLLESESFGILSAAPKNKDGELLPEGFIVMRTPQGNTVSEWEAFARYIQNGKLRSDAGEDSVENDDFVPLGYTLGAVLLCAIILFCMRKRK